MFCFKYDSKEWVAVGKLLFEHEFFFYCSSCDHEWKSFITPFQCPNCKVKAENDPQAVEITHKTVTQKTFPFAVFH